MAIQGVVFAHSLNLIAPNIKIINETHPKVAYYAQTGRRHDYLTKEDQIPYNSIKTQESPSKVAKKVYNNDNAVRMWNELLDWIRLSAASRDLGTMPISIIVGDHEWGALYSAWFTYRHGFVSRGCNLMQFEDSDNCTLNLSHPQKSRIDSLDGLGAAMEGVGTLANLFEQRIMVPDGIKDKVTYFWLPASSKT